MGYLKVTTSQVFKLMEWFMNFWITVNSTLYISVTLGRYWHMLDKLYINIINYLLLYFSSRGVVCHEYGHKHGTGIILIHLINRLLLSWPLTNFIPAYDLFCQTFIPWLALCHRLKIKYFSKYQASPHFSSPGWNRNSLIMSFATEFSYIM